MELTADKILRVYRGDREIEPENLKKVQEGFNERGYIKLRSLERILFGAECVTGPGIVKITSCGDLALKQGLAVLDAPSTQLINEHREVQVLVYNSTPFLNQIDKGSIIAQGTIQYE